MATYEYAVFRTYKHSEEVRLVIGGMNSLDQAKVELELLLERMREVKARAEYEEAHNFNPSNFNYVRWNGGKHNPQKPIKDSLYYIARREVPKWLPVTTMKSVS